MPTVLFTVNWLSCSNVSLVFRLRRISKIQYPVALAPADRFVCDQAPYPSFACVSSFRFEVLLAHSSSRLHLGSFPLNRLNPESTPGPQSSSQCQMSTLPFPPPMSGVAFCSVCHRTAIAAERSWFVAL